MIRSSDDGLHRLLAELHRVFDQINVRFYEGQLPVPVITIQSRGRQKGVLGWFTTVRVWRSPEGERYEINLVAESLDRPLSLIVETLLHETVHLANWSREIRDCTVRQYHNRHFKHEAERIGLIAEQRPGAETRGWAFTRLGPIGEEFVASLGLPSDEFRLTRRGVRAAGGGGGDGGNGGGGEGETPTGSTTRMRKWVCSCAPKPVIVRCAVALDATCQRCGKPFRLA